MHYTVALNPATVPRTGYLPNDGQHLTGSGQRAPATANYYSDADFGLRPPGGASIGDTLWIDRNEDGVVDAARAALPNVTVNLYDSTGTNLLATTTTDANGNYSFTGLYAGNYVVSVDETSIVTTTNGITATIAGGHGPGQRQRQQSPQPCNVNVPTDSSVIDTVDFGYNWAGQIGDFTWYDNNGNGLYEPGLGEDPAPNVTLVLYYDDNGNGKPRPGEPIVAVPDHRRQRRLPVRQPAARHATPWTRTSRRWRAAARLASS